MFRRTFGCFLVVFAFFLCYAATLQAQKNTSVSGRTLRINGMVSASDDNEAIGFATIKVLNSPLGAVSSRKGTFVLNLPPNNYTILCSRIGYAPDTLQLELRSDTTLTFVLSPLTKQLPEVVVNAEDPGTRLMRRVIERKLRLRDSLQTYSYTLYSKFIASTDTLTAGRRADESDTTVVAILESYSRGYFRSPDQYFNEIFQKRQSANIPPSANIAAFGTAINCFEDEMNLLSEEIATPFHPSATDYYFFTIEYTFISGGQRCAVVTFQPKGNSRKLFSGELIIDTAEAIPMKAVYKPNKAVQLPFDAQITIEQTFQQVCEQGFTQPRQTHITGTAKAELLFVLSPRLDIDIETVAYDFRCNLPLESSLFSRRRIEATRASQIIDSAFWADSLILPLKDSEKKAYNQIQSSLENPDSVITTGLLNAIFSPVNRVITRLNQPPFTGFEDILAYNRIHGLYMGIGLFDTIGGNWIWSGKIGYGFADKHTYGELRTEYQFGDAQEHALEAKGYRTLHRRDNPNIVQRPLITTAAFFARSDYGDYYYADGGELSIKTGWGQQRFIRRNIWERPSGIRLFLRAETHRSALRNTNFALLGGADTFRINPAIQEGNLRSFGAELRFGFHPLRRVSTHGIMLTAEHSPKDFLGNSFDFTHLTASYFLRTPTLPLWELNLRIDGAYTLGTPPPQRYSSLESGIGALSAGNAFRALRVKEFYGDRFVSVLFEHNFGELVPGLLRIPNIAALGLEFVLSTGAGYSDFRVPQMPTATGELPTTATTRNGFYGEIGFGINKLLLFFRIDVTARITQRERPQFIFTFQPAVF